MTGYCSIKNFERFQHYKDRNPPWIRLYNSLLDDYEFGLLPDASKAHLLASMLLASRYDNKIPFDAEWIGRRINATEVVDLELLVSSGFLLPDEACSKMLAERKHVASKVLCQSREEKSREDIELAKANSHPPDGGSGVSKKRLPKKSGAYPEAFETLWQAYHPIASPNSTKADAHKAWEKLSPEERDACHAGLTRYVSWLSEEKQRRGDTKAKHLATFINKRGWEPFLEGASVIPFSLADEHPDIPPERLAEIMAEIERDYPTSPWRR